MSTTPVSYISSPFCRINFNIIVPSTPDFTKWSLFVRFPTKDFDAFLVFLMRATCFTLCVDKPTRCNTSYEWPLLSINWLYMFRTITSPSSGASSHKLYNALVYSCYQASLAVAWMYIRATARLT